MSSPETFLNYRHFRWLRINILLVGLLVILYFLDDPIGGRHGATTLGLSYGILAALAVIYLLWFAIRKRSYYRSTDTVKGWLAAHVWLGASLIIIVPLHCGFYFDLNVHTLAYVLLVLTILSGIWGAANYSILASSVPSHRGAGSIKELLEKTESVSREILKLTEAKSTSFKKLASTFDFAYNPGIIKSFWRRSPSTLDPKLVAPISSEIGEAEHGDALKILTLLNQKLKLVNAIEEEIRVKCLLRFWLYLHAPLSYALFAALVVHVVWEIYYW